MVSYTRHLAATSIAIGRFEIQLTDNSPVTLAQSAIVNTTELRYSPVMPAYLTPGNAPVPLPNEITSISFLFSPTPYKTLGAIKPHLGPDELPRMYFTEGLASILVMNVCLERSKEICGLAGGCPLEYWPITDGILEFSDIFTQTAPSTKTDNDLNLPTTTEAELQVYIEQISSSIASLWHSYSIYIPTEKETLRQIVTIVAALIQKHAQVKAGDFEKKPLDQQKTANAIVSALVEISAALSYAVTQGTSGSTPILCNRSPFPHHSLLGIGGSVRALTKFTRYLESAFVSRSAGKVIEKQYSQVSDVLPANPGIREASRRQNQRPGVALGVSIWFRRVPTKYIKNRSPVVRPRGDLTIAIVVCFTSWISQSFYLETVRRVDESEIRIRIPASHLKIQPGGLQTRLEPVLKMKLLVLPALTTNEPFFANRGRAVNENIKSRGLHRQSVPSTFTPDKHREKASLGTQKVAVPPPRQRLGPFPLRPVPRSLDRAALQRSKPLPPLARKHPTKIGPLRKLRRSKLPGSRHVLPPTNAPC